MTKFILYSLLGAIVASAWWSVPLMTKGPSGSQYVWAVLATVAFVVVLIANAVRSWED